MLYLTSGEIESGISFWKILGRKVLSKSGASCGRVVGIRFKKDRILDFTIFYSTWTLVRVHSSMVQNLEDIRTDSYLILNIDPFYTLMKKTVYDHNGTRLGQVARVKRKENTNEVESITVKSGTVSRGRVIAWEDIAVHKKSILLKDNSAGEADYPSNNSTQEPGGA